MDGSDWGSEAFQGGSEKINKW